MVTQMDFKCKSVNQIYKKKFYSYNSGGFHI